MWTSRTPSSRNELLEPDAQLVRRVTPSSRYAATWRGLLSGAALTETRATFAYDVASFAIVELDALHLGAAQRLGTALTCITFDIRQAQLARALGFRVAGR